MLFMTALLLVLLSASPDCLAAEPSSPAAPPSLHESRSADFDSRLSSAELEQLLAPVALYPDSLLAQVLMASTYPLEVVSASRWAKAHARLAGEELEEALRLQTWDPSVTSLVAFPEVLFMMDEKLDWTEKLGNAFLAQQQDCMDAVQRLRARAQAAGSLVSGKEQTVSVRKNPGSSQQAIVIEPSQPDVFYVPRYNSALVYGYWPYPTYPPYAWYPSAYVTTGNLLSFGMGMTVGYALWGDLDWHRRGVYINVNRYSHFWRRVHHRPPDWRHDRPGRPSGWHGRNDGAPSWRHNPVHRKGVPYRHQSVQRQFRGGGNDIREQQRIPARQAFRDYARHDGFGRLRQFYGNQKQRPEDAPTRRPGVTGQRPQDQRPQDQRPQDQRPQPGAVGQRPQDQRPHPGAVRPRPQDQRPQSGAIKQRPQERRPQPGAVGQRPQDQRPQPGAVGQRPQDQRPQPGAIKQRPQERRPQPGAVRQRPQEQRSQPGAVKQRPREQRSQSGAVKPRPQGQRSQPDTVRQRPQEQRSQSGAPRGGGPRGGGYRGGGSPGGGQMRR